MKNSIKIMYKHASRYMRAINGTTFSVTLAILFIPPMIIIPTIIAIIHPIIAPAANTFSRPIKSLRTIVA